MKWILLIFLLFFLVGCVPEITNFEECIAAGNPAMESHPRQCRADGKTFVEEIEGLPPVPEGMEEPPYEEPIEEPTGESKKPTGSVEETIDLDATEHNSEVKELMEKSAKANNYQYDYSFSVLKSNGIYSIGSTYVVYIKGERIKKSYLSPVKMEEGYFDEIYLIDKEAYGVCNQAVILCENGQEATSLGYNKYKLEMTPWNLVQNVPYDAEIVGTEKFDNRNAKILEYFEDGDKVKLTVDIYSGLALKKFIYGWEDDVEVILEKHYFRDLATSNVKNADVSW